MYIYIQNFYIYSKHSKYSFLYEKLTNRIIKIVQFSTVFITNQRKKQHSNKVRNSNYRGDGRSPLMHYRAITISRWRPLCERAKGVGPAPGTPPLSAAPPGDDDGPSGGLRQRRQQAQPPGCGQVWLPSHPLCRTLHPGCRSDRQYLPARG